MLALVVPATMTTLCRDAAATHYWYEVIGLNGIKWGKLRDCYKSEIDV
jgi:hypothetical protein